MLARLTEFAAPFRRARVLDPLPGVEVRPHRVIWGPGPPELGPPLLRSELRLQVFHPTVEKAGEASASIRVVLNSLWPLTYGSGQPLTEDDEGPIFIEPRLMGEIVGAPLLYTGELDYCVVVFKAYDRPLWKPVSRGRYLWPRPSRPSVRLGWRS